MNAQIERVEAAAIAGMRETFRHGLDCQFVHYSFIGRRLADIYVARVDGQDAGYAAVSNKYDKGRLIEFHVAAEFRGSESALFRELLAASGATHIEAQTNMPSALAVLREFGRNVETEKLLFNDGFNSALTCDGTFRHRSDADGPGMFGREEETLSDWVVEAGGDIVAAGGFLTHYNPPYGDVFMEVAEGSRRRGYGSYLVQEVKRVCREAGLVPAARCNPSNIGSRKTLEKAGMPVCGEILVGEVARKVD